MANQVPSMRDARYGLVLNLNQSRAQRGALLGAVNAPGDDDAKRAKDWTVYIQRVSRGSNNGAQYEVEVRWGSGGAVHTDTFPLGFEAEFALHYVSANAPQVTVRTVEAESAPIVGVDTLIVTAAPGRLATHVIQYRVQATLVELTDEAIADIVAPFGTSKMWVQAWTFTAGVAAAVDAAVGPYAGGNPGPDFQMVWGEQGIVSANDINAASPWPVAGRRRWRVVFPAEGVTTAWVDCWFEVMR